MSSKLLLVLTATAGILAAQDPPNRVGRLSYISGPVSFQPGGVDDWAAATVNRPLTTGDQLFADDGARAEIRTPGTAFRIGSRTAFEFLNLDDRSTQVRLSQGVLQVHVRRLNGGENLEVDTPNLAFTIQRPGDYRFETYPDNNQSSVTVRSGEGEATIDCGSFPVDARRQAVITGQNPAQYAVYNAPGFDDFDDWAHARDRHDDRLEASRYVSPNVVGYEDLDDYGDWQWAPEYGRVWIPRTVPSGWAPYHFGHWAWVDPWGWTWVDDAPWGFAPFHYGRWAFHHARWCWVPGPVAVAPVYAPALVAWFGFGGGHGGGIQLSVGFGGGGVGWFPLGPRDVYIPSYRSSPQYVNRVNVSNTTVINNTQITNVYNNYTRTGNIPTATYRNRTVPGAMAVVPQSALAGARPVQQVIGRVQANQVSRISTVSAAPRVAPQIDSVLGAARRGNIPRPAPSVISRAVVAKSAPPPAPAPFQQRQALLAKDPGRPIPIQQQQQIGRSAPSGVIARRPVQVITQRQQVTPPVLNTPAPAPPVIRRPAGRAAPPSESPQPPRPSPQAQPSQTAPPPAAQPQQQIQRPMPQPRTVPQVQPSRPVPPPVAQPQPQIQRPMPQPRQAPQAQPSRPMPPLQAQPQPPAQRQMPQPRTVPQVQPSRPVPPPVAQPQPQIQRPVPQPRQAPQAQPSRPVPPPTAQARPPVQRSTPQPRDAPQAQSVRPAPQPRQQPRVQQPPPPRPQESKAQPPPQRRAPPPQKEPNARPADETRGQRGR